MRRVSVRTVLVVLALVMAQVASLFVFPQPVQAFSGEGSGTEAEPYEVATCEQLQSIGEVVDIESFSASYVLTQDIDCSETATWNDGAGFKPIAGTDNLLEHAFFGSFDGQGHSISGLYINRPESVAVGLFAVTANADIRNLTLEATIAGGNFTGGIVGFAYLGTDVTNVAVNGDISGTADATLGHGLPLAGVGGIAGITIGASGSSIVSISKSSAHGIISAEVAGGDVFNTAGGLVGMYTSGGIINDSYSTAHVVSASAGQVAVGGFAGLSAFFVADTISEINNSYSIGEVVAKEGNIAGGFFAGSADGIIIKNSFTASPVVVEADEVPFEVGGFMGISDGEDILTNNYIDVNRTAAFSCISGGSGNSEGCTGVNYEPFTDPNYFFGNNVNPPLNEWDFECTWVIQTNDYPVHLLDVEACEADLDPNPDPEPEQKPSKKKPVIPRNIIVPTTVNPFLRNPQPNDTTINLNDFAGYMNGGGHELTNLKVGQVIAFEVEIDGKIQQHTITITAIGKGEVTITVASTPFDVTLPLSTTKTIAIEGQDVMKVTLTAITPSGVSIVFEKLAQADGSPPQLDNSESPEAWVGTETRKGMVIVGLISGVIVVGLAASLLYRRHTRGKGSV